MAVKERTQEVVTKAKRRAGIENPSAADADGNVGTVRGALRAFGEGDFDAFVDALREDVQWEAPGGNFPGGSELEGRDAIRERYVGDVGRTFTDFGYVPENFVDTDDGAVIVIGRFTGDGAHGGSVDAPAVQIWQFGRSTEAELIRIYTDSAAFPEVMTEKELREEEKKREEQDSGDSGDSGDQEDGG